MNNQSYKQQEIVIDIKDILWKLLSQWKAILLVSIVTALIVCGTGYLKDMRTYKAQQMADAEARKQSSLPAEERISDLLEALPEEDREAVQVLVREREWLSDQQEYLKESIYMNLDAADQIMVVQPFEIKVEDYAVEPLLSKSYEMYVLDEDFAKALVDSVSPENDYKYVSELLSYSVTEKSNTNLDNGRIVFSVSVKIPYEADPDSVAEAVKKNIEKYSQDLKSKYSHEINDLEYSVSRNYGYDMSNRQNTVLYWVNNMDNTIKNAEQSLSEQQKMTFEAIMKIKDSAESVDSGEDLSDNTIENDSMGDNENKVKAPAFNVKKAIEGFVLGLLLYVGIYIVLIIMKGTVNSALCAGCYTGTRLLGEVYFNETPTMLGRLLRSNMIDKYHYKEKANTTAQIGRIVESFAAICSHAGTKTLTIMDCIGAMDRNASGIISSIVSETEKKGIETNTIEVSETIYENMLLDSEKAVIMVGDCTKTTTIRSLMTLCNEYDIKTLGSTYIAKM